MGIQRYVDTSFWDDEFIVELDPSEKLVYIYLLTNPLTNIAGVYKITRKRMCFDTGFNSDTIGHILAKFEKAEKVFTCGEYVIIKSWCKHQKWETMTKIKSGIVSILKDLPDDVIQALENCSYNFDLSLIGHKKSVLDESTIDYDRLSKPTIDYDRLSKPTNYLNSNTNLNSNINNIADALSDKKKPETSIKEKDVVSDKENDINLFSECEVPVFVDNEKSNQEIIEQSKQENLDLPKEKERKSLAQKKECVTGIPKAQRDEIFNTYFENCKLLFAMGMIHYEQPVIAFDKVGRTLTKRIKDYGFEEVLKVVNNACQDEWVVNIAGYEFSAILSETVFVRLLNGNIAKGKPSKSLADNSKQSFLSKNQNTVTSYDVEW